MSRAKMEEFFDSLSNEQEEPVFKHKLISLLNNRNSAWKDGDNDQDLQNSKSADIVNNDLQIAVEIKIEDASRVLESIPYGTKGFVRDLVPNNIFNVKDEKRAYWYSRRYRKYIKDALNKFENYPNYKTLLFIRTFVSPLYFTKDIINELISEDRSTMISIKRPQNIGGFLLMNAGDRNVRYYQNEYAAANSQLTHREVCEIFNYEICTFEKFT
jgi:hypothetical protein